MLAIAGEDGTACEDCEVDESRSRVRFSRVPGSSSKYICVRRCVPCVNHSFVSELCEVATYVASPQTFYSRTCCFPQTQSPLQIHRRMDRIEITTLHSRYLWVADPGNRIRSKVVRLSLPGARGVGGVGGYRLLHMPRSRSHSHRFHSSPSPTITGRSNDSERPCRLTQKCTTGASLRHPPNYWPPPDRCGQTFRSIQDDRRMYMSLHLRILRCRKLRRILSCSPVNIWFPCCPPVGAWIYLVLMGTGKARA